MRYLACALCLSAALQLAAPTPVSFPDEARKTRKLEVINPPKLPYLEHLERDPSTLLPSDAKPKFRGSPRDAGPRGVSPRFGGGFSVTPSKGGVSASFSGSAGGAGGSHSASQSFSFGFNDGFSASQSASQSSSFNGFGSGFSGSQSSSQAASFGGSGGSAAASAASAFAAGGHAGSQSSSQAFGFNGLGGFASPNDEVNFGDDAIDIRHRGAPGFPFPRRGLPRGPGPGSFRQAGTSAFRQGGADFLSVFVSE